jgi:hypothetical protein
VWNVASTHAIILFVMCLMVTGLYERLSGKGGVVYGLWRGRMTSIGWLVNLVRGGFCEKAFCQNGLDQYKAAVLGQCIRYLFYVF